ncbi:probable WRKY transcription factor 35 [Salvia splendens]|nr:probable WRKY transcription factor 35 [Salvia splendens]
MMEKNNQGDLADVVRATTTATATASRTSINYPPEYFGDPFTYIADIPLIQSPPTTSHLFYNSNPPSNIFSRMLEISPNIKPRELPSPPPRNTPIKRRKSQAKKVVCIPAAAPANSRATGEVVPSDLWAWRKYGQKPIKGSPYPRGYYRCSSSKGCSARKQVERSRTDPNMLMITYTSEHNHPWPTQRNALAGSTRSQPPKTIKDSEKDTNPKNHDHKETSIDNHGAVKEEVDNRVEAEFDETYKPDQDSFFADLGEIGDNPLSLFGQGFPSRDDGNSHSDLDPFDLYDWAISTTATEADAVEDSAGKA